MIRAARTSVSSGMLGRPVERLLRQERNVHEAPARTGARCSSSLHQHVEDVVAEKAARVA